MMYPYMTLADETEITHSGVQQDGSVKVYIEKPVDNGFVHATCILPAYKWIDVEGYTDDEIDKFTDYLKHNAHLIMEFASEGGFLNATAV